MAERITDFVKFGACSVYTLLDEHDTPLYVGLTARNVGRINEHSPKSWWPNVASARFEHMPTRGAGNRREMELIRELRPAHNTVGVSSLMEQRIAEADEQKAAA